MPELRWKGKCDASGKRAAPLRVSLPFQTVETVNESVQERQRALDLFDGDQPTEWRNRLIWGDKKYVLPSLLPEFAGAVDLVYIDPPFFTGDNFSFTIDVAGEDFTREPNLIEQKAYRDTWGGGVDGYLNWLYTSLTHLRELLSETGSIYVHLDWHVGHFAKLVLDEVFGSENFRNEIVWHYYNKMQGNRLRGACRCLWACLTRSVRGSLLNHRLGPGQIPRPLTVERWRSTHTDRRSGAVPTSIPLGGRDRSEGAIDRVGHSARRLSCEARPLSLDPRELLFR